jgi:hypothetical protein
VPATGERRIGYPCQFVLTEKDDSSLGSDPPNAGRCLDATENGHADVEHNDVWLKFFSIAHTLQPVCSLAYNSTIASTFSSLPIAGRGFLTLLYRMIEVREISRKGRVCANPVISASVIPLAKYTLFASRERFSSGNTAIERIAADPCFAADGDAEALSGFTPPKNR